MTSRLVEKPAERRHSRGWTPITLVSRGVRDLAHLPIRAFVYLGIVPGIWMAPELLAPPISTVSTQPGFWLFARMGITVWNSFLAGGMLLVALKLARRIPAGPKSFLEGLRYWPRIACLELVVSLPYIAVTLMRPLTELEFQGKLLVVFVLVCVAIVSGIVLLRTVTAPILIVEQNATVKHALFESWRSSAVDKGRVAALCVALLAPSIVWAVWWKNSPLIQRMGHAVTRPLYMLVWVHLYEGVHGCTLASQKPSEIIS